VVVKKTKLSEIIEARDVEIKRDSYFVNAYTVDLPLDSIPDHVWQDIFEQHWKSSRHLWERKLFIVGDRLRLVTPPEEMAKKLDWVRQIIDQTNLKVEEFNGEVEARELQISQTRAELTEQIFEKERRTVEVIRDILRKRFKTL
jgi:hypothetical protein